jgi:hypothetical protein
LLLLLLLLLEKKKTKYGIHRSMIVVVSDEVLYIGREFEKCHHQLDSTPIVGAAGAMTAC